MQIINEYGAKVSPCKTLISMLNKSVSSSGELTFAFVLLYLIIIAVTVSLERLYHRSIYSIFSLSIESNASEKSTNNSVASRFFTRTPSRIRRIVRMCAAVDRFPPKLKIFS